MNISLDSNACFPLEFLLHISLDSNACFPLAFLLHISLDSNACFPLEFLLNILLDSHALHFPLPTSLHFPLPSTSHFPLPPPHFPLTPLSHFTESLYLEITEGSQDNLLASQLLLTVTDESHIVQVIFTSVHYTITFEVRGQLYGLTSSLKELYCIGQ